MEQQEPKRYQRHRQTKGRSITLSVRLWRHIEALASAENTSLSAIIARLLIQALDLDEEKEAA